jgi:cellulose synthase/poly-beta-1,6-N-acetylglucosamine synthase-like glycosyltransferase
MSRLAAAIALAPLLIGLYAYVGYPAILWVLSKFHISNRQAATTGSWPAVTITLPVYNAAATIRATLDRLLVLDYPRDRLQLLVISDGSTDGTEQIVETYAGQGVELLRMAERRGKTAAENAALSAARGELIVNVDATIMVPAGSLKRLVRAFEDPTIGVASGRDVSVGDSTQVRTGAESRYVGYEMWIRHLETSAGSIVGASGCFYAIRRHIHGEPLPADLSWDFASVLVARLKGLRSVSVSDAICIVPRSESLGTELKRKVRTMARGIRTLFHHRQLMNPFRFGGFSLMLISHKLLRWLPYLLAPVSLVAAVLFAAAKIGAWPVGIALIAVAIITSHLPTVPAFRTARATVVASFLTASLAAGFLAWWDVIRGAPMAIWDPTPRSSAHS